MTLVAALDRAGVIGSAGTLPWRLPDDQRHFKRLTRGHCVVMGRLTFESIGRPLPDRVNLVVTRNPEWRAEGAIAVQSVDAALDEAARRDETECFVVGGAEIYALALPRADRLVLTRVEANVEGDVFFPDVDVSRAPWKLVAESAHEADARHAYAFRIQDYERAR